MFSSGPWLPDYIVDRLGGVLLPPSAVYSWLFLKIAANKLLVHVTPGHNIGLHTATSTPTSASRCTTSSIEVSPTKMWNLSRISFNNVQKSTRHSYAIPLTIFSLQNDSCFMRGFYTLNSQESGGLILPELLRNKSLLSPDCATAAKVMGHDSRVHFKVCEKNYSVTANSEPFDVAIIGGGMVGLALASALSSTPFTKHLNVAIVDPNPALGGSSYYIKNEIPGSRVSTVTPATISFLRDIGAWEHVKHQRHAFFDQMQVWDYTGLGYTRYCSRDVGKEYLGCVVENKVLCNSLLLSLQEKDFKKTIIPAKLTSMTVSSRSSSSGVSSGQSNTLDKSRTNNSEETAEPMHLQSLVRLELSDGQHIYSKLVVGADGAKSRVREMAGIKTTGWDYSQSGLICTVEHTGENHCAWQRFLPSGPIALLPIGDNFSNIVWTMSSNEANRHKLMSEDDFVKAVNYALDCGYGPHPQSNFLDNYIGRLPWGSGTTSIKESFQAPPKVIDVVSERMAFPLSLMHALEYSSSQFVLIGDAAHAVHPLAGQGVNLGFGDASTLTKVISEGISMGTDFADLALLKRYEKERKAANIPWMAILDGFQKAYSIDFGPINLLRAAALHGAQYIAPLKRNIVSYAMGEWNWPRFT